MTDWFYDREHESLGIAVARIVGLILALLPLVAIGLQFFHRH